MFDQHLEENLPPLIICDREKLKKNAIEVVEEVTMLNPEEIKEKYRWRIYLHSIRIFFDARSWDFFKNVSRVLIASAIAFASTNDYIVLYPIVVIFLLCTIFFIVFESLQVILVIGDRLHISDDDFKELWSYSRIGLIISWISSLTASCKIGSRIKTDTTTKSKDVTPTEIISPIIHRI